MKTQSTMKVFISWNALTSHPTSEKIEKSVYFLFRSSRNRFFFALRIFFNSFLLGLTQVYPVKVCPVDTRRLIDVETTSCVYWVSAYTNINGVFINVLGHLWRLFHHMLFHHMWNIRRVAWPKNMNELYIVRALTRAFILLKRSVLSKAKPSYFFGLRSKLQKK